MNCCLSQDTQGEREYVIYCKTAADLEAWHAAVTMYTVGSVMPEPEPEPQPEPQLQSEVQIKKATKAAGTDGEPEPEPETESEPEPHEGQWQGRVRCYFPRSGKLVEAAHLELAKGGSLLLTPVAVLLGHDSSVSPKPADGEDGDAFVPGQDVVHSGEVKDCEVVLPKALALQPRPLPWKPTSFTIEPMLWMTPPAIR